MVDLTNEERTYIFNVFHQVTIPGSQATIVAKILEKLQVVDENKPVNTPVEGQVIDQKSTDPEPKTDLNQPRFD